MLLISGVISILCLQLIDGSSCPRNLFPKQPASSMKATSAENPLQTKWFRNQSDIFWCPLNKVGSRKTEYLIVDLGEIHEIRIIEHKGTSKLGYKSAQLYFVEYKREESKSWIKIMVKGQEHRIYSNADPETEDYETFRPPLYARWIKLIPFNYRLTKICAKFEVFGCDYKGNVLEYKVSDGSGQFKDEMYDGEKTNGLLHKGMGKLKFRKLTDEEVNKFRELGPFSDKNVPIGWSKSNLGAENFKMFLRFDGERNFTNLCMYAYVDRSRQLDLPKKIVIHFSKDGMKFEPKNKIVYDYTLRDNKLAKVSIDLLHRIGKYIQIEFWFKENWIIIEGLHFTSESSNPLVIPKTKEDTSSKSPIPMTSLPATYPDKSVNKIFSPLLAYILVFIAAFLLILLAISIPIGTILIRRQKIKNKKSKEALQRHSRDENVRLFLPPHFKDCPMPPNTNGVMPPLFTVTNFQQQPSYTTSAPITSISASHQLTCNDSSIYTSVTGSDNDSSILPSQPQHPTTSSSSSTDRLMITSPSTHTISKQPIISLPPPPPPLPPQNSCPIINPLLPHHINLPNNYTAQPILPNDFSATSFVTLNRPYNQNFYHTTTPNNKNISSLNSNNNHYYATNISNPQLSRSQLNLRNNFDNNSHFGGHHNLDQVQSETQNISH